MGMLRKFVRANGALSDALTPGHIEQLHAYERYRLEGEALLGGFEGGRILDVGGGKAFLFADLKRSRGHHLTVLEISAEEAAHNVSADAMVVDSICNAAVDPGAPFDVITVRAGTEHFPDNRAAIRNYHRHLKPGGVLLLTFANRHAPFAVLNRLLPDRLSDLAVRGLLGGAKNADKIGFSAKYDICDEASFRKALEEVGFEVEAYYPSYYSSKYFQFFVPLYLVSLVFDHLRHVIGWRQICSYHFFKVRKPA